MSFIHERTSGSQGRKYVPFLNNYNDLVFLTSIDDSGKGISDSDKNLAAAIFAELWQYQGESSNS